MPTAMARDTESVVIRLFVRFTKSLAWISKSLSLEKLTIDKIVR